MTKAITALGAWLPNLVSLGRLIIAPAAVWNILHGQFVSAFWLLVLAGFSDVLDGVLARWLDARTVIGMFLDPIADKIFMVGVFAALGQEGVLPVWLVVLVISRDIFLVGGWATLYVFRLIAAAKVQPILISKINTICQLGVIGCALAGHSLDPPILRVVPVLVWVVVVTTLVSWGGYMRIVWLQLRSGNNAS